MEASSGLQAEDHGIVIVGGGPVGLYLGCRLAASSTPVTVLERRSRRAAESRAIGIHPPALELLAEVGVASAMVSRGVKVLRGLAFSDRSPIGAADFSKLPPPYRFVLTLPQADTEELLEERLAALAPKALQRGVAVSSVVGRSDQVTLACDSQLGRRIITARLVVGCDGAQSLVRRAMGVAFAGGPYPDRYLMGDTVDTTRWHDAAAVFFSRAGVVESFPLPHGRRRWVVKTDGRSHDNSHDTLVQTLASEVPRRTGYEFPAGECSFVSAFGVYRHVASRMVAHRLALAGDAAHVVSPIGGQGMNLGWLDAADLARALAADGSSDGGDKRLHQYDRRRRRAAKRAVRRARFHTLLGRATRLPWARDAVVKAMLSRWLHANTLARFTLRGL